MERGATLTVRIIRSFQYRNIKVIVLKDVDLLMVAKDFMDYVIEDIQGRKNIPLPVRNYTYDTMKIEHQPFQSKTNNTVINTSDDDALILDFSRTLKENGVCHETELSFFKRADYEEYKKSPEFKW